MPRKVRYQESKFLMDIVHRRLDQHLVELQDRTVYKNRLLLQTQKLVDILDMHLNHQERKILVHKPNIR